MASTDPITATEITDAAKGPLRVTGDEGTVQERPIDELIAGDRYANSKCVSGPPYGMRMARIRFPGTT